MKNLGIAKANRGSLEKIMVKIFLDQSPSTEGRGARIAFPKKLSVCLAESRGKKNCGF
jgi:hypothetical protein